jgi:hypothetical protein
LVDVRNFKVLRIRNWEEVTKKFKLTHDVSAHKALTFEFEFPPVMCLGKIRNERHVQNYISNPKN